MPTRGASVGNCIVALVIRGKLGEVGGSGLVSLGYAAVSAGTI